MSDFLAKCLKSFNIADLTNVLDNTIVEGLSNFDIPITKTTLVEIILSNKSFKVLGNQEFREKLIEKNEAILKEKSIDLEELKRLKWSRDKDRIKLVTIFEGTVSEAEITNKKREKLEEICSDGETLFGYQNWMRKNVLDFLISKKEKTLVHMPTGAGKTKTTITAIIDFMRHKSPKDTTVVWFAHSDELCEQAIESFHELWKKFGIGKANVWRMWAGFRELNYKGRGVNFIVTSFQSAYGWLKTNDDNAFQAYLKIKEKCDLILIDEAHMSTAPTYSLVINNFANDTTKRIGLTATPGRHHIDDHVDETVELADFFNNNLVTMTNHEGEECSNPIAFLQDEKILSQINQEVIQGSDFELTDKEIYDIQENLEISPSLIKKISTDKQRFLTIANKTLSYAKIEKKQTLVFCPSKDNALLLSTYLNNRGCKSAAITSDLDMVERHEKIDAFKRNRIQVLTNFGVLTTGFDAPNIDVVFIARPTLSVVLYSQMIGRGLRGSRVGGTDFVKVIDVKDNLERLPNVQEAFTFFNEFYR